MGAAVNCRPLLELRQDDEPGFGGKSVSLGELLAAQIPVPGGFGVSTAAYRSFISEAGLEGTISAAMSRAKDGDVAAVGAASDAISKAMQSAPLPDAIRADVERAYGDLGELYGSPSVSVAVRSSAVGEDSAEATFAGQQETYLWVQGAQHLCEAIQDCWASLYSPLAISYRAQLGDRAVEAAMGVTVQAMVDAERSGVMFTCNPLTGDPSMVAINASWGLGLAVVGGEVTPDDYLVSKVTGEVVREQVNQKKIEYVADPGGRGAVPKAVPKERSEARCLDDETIAALMDVARRVERHFGSRQDIEWAIARGASDPDNLFIVQSRPVTGLSQQEAPKPKSAMSLVMRTFGAPTRRD
jgi:pyruvate,water dikinase